MTSARVNPIMRRGSTADKPFDMVVSPENAGWRFSGLRVLDLPIGARARFFTGKESPDGSGVKDVTWITAAGREMSYGDWIDRRLRALGMLIDGRAQSSGIVAPGSDVTVLMILNANADVLPFTLPGCNAGARWERLLDTDDEGRPDGEAFAIGDVYPVTGRSLVLFALKS